MCKTKIDLPEKVRRNVIAILNVKGPNFIALHELFDKILEAHLQEKA